MQQMSILWMVILIILTNKWFRSQIVFCLITIAHKWEQYYNLWSIINITFFYSIHLLLLLNFIKDCRCEQIIMFVYYLHISWMVDWTEYLNELKISRNTKHASTHHIIVCITCCMIASPSMFIISGAWKSTTSQTGVTNLQPTELVDDCCLQSSNQIYVSQFDISQLITHMEAILTDFRFYTSYADNYFSKCFYLSLLWLL